MGEYTWEQARNYFPELQLMQTKKELDELLELMKERKVNSVMEIGFYMGGTVKAWDSVVKDGYIISIDKAPIPKNVLKEVDESLKNARMTFIQYDSTSRQAIESVEMCLLGFNRKKEDDTTEFIPGYGKVDMLFIDGCHEGIYPMRDYSNYERFVKDGGLIVWHDLNMPNVAQQYEEVLSENGYEHKEIIDPEDPNTIAQVNGIGVMFKKASE